MASRICAKARRRQLARLMQLFDEKCWWCRDRVEVVSPDNPNVPQEKRAMRDHLIQIRDGGSDRVNNLVLACPFCHAKRQTMGANQWEKYRAYKGFPVGEVLPHLHITSVC